ncbi:uncharacterized protein LOC114293426 [Camellia sinensis]|uniref:uncharacterized protein LOC114293426 n=1 Tax=Camellia sinensis TaxID=4442 RepID=UPI001035681D|nr:uncharacterized protein LOC114293426 [Camellia sinensis]
MAQYQQQLATSYNQRVQLRRYTPGELVLKKVLPAGKNPADGKLGPNWDGPYQIDSVVGVRAYQLKDIGSKHFSAENWRQRSLRRLGTSSPSSRKPNTLTKSFVPSTPSSSFSSLLSTHNMPSQVALINSIEIRCLVPKSLLNWRGVNVGGYSIKVLHFLLWLGLCYMVS